MIAVQLAAQVCVVLAVTCGAAVLAATRSARLAIGVLLDFLLAAGLLRLSQQVTAGTLLTTAAVVAVRRLLLVGLAVRDTRAVVSRRAGPPARPAGWGS